jgi:hypothetical protein
VEGREDPDRGAQPQPLTQVNMLQRNYCSRYNVMFKGWFHYLFRSFLLLFRTPKIDILVFIFLEPLLPDDCQSECYIFRHNTC